MKLLGVSVLQGGNWFPPLLQVCCGDLEVNRRTTQFTFDLSQDARSPHRCLPLQVLSSAVSHLGSFLRACPPPTTFLALSVYPLIYLASYCQASPVPSVNCELPSSALS